MPRYFSPEDLRETPPARLDVKDVMPIPLSDIEIQRQLGALVGWARRGNELVRSYEFPTFAQAIAFVGRVAPVADAHNHHPDIDIRYNKVILHLSTHSAGGITANDFKLAQAIDSP